MNQFIIVIRRFPPEGGGTEKQAWILAKTLSYKTSSCSLFGACIKSPIPENTPNWVHTISDSPLRFWGTVKYHIHLFHELRKIKNEISKRSFCF